MPDKPKSMLVTLRVAAQAAPMPTNTPTITSASDSRTTIQSTPRGSAPSAMRSPISPVRRSTLKDISP